MKFFVVFLLVLAGCGAGLGVWLRAEWRAREPSNWAEVEALIPSGDYIVGRGEAYIPVKVRREGVIEDGAIVVNESDARYAFTKSDIGEWQRARAFPGLLSGLDVCMERGFETCQGKRRYRFLGPAIGLAIVLVGAVSLIVAMVGSRRAPG